MHMVHVRLFAAARAAAKTERIELASGRVSEILSQCSQMHPDLARIIPQCSFLVDGVANHDRDVIVAPGSQLDILPKFAGG